MNEVKEAGAKIGELVEKMEAITREGAHGLIPVNVSIIDSRWLDIGKIELQKGFMALTRAVAKPGFF